jgi:spermidine/putrescine transport system permease protein
MSAVTAPSPPAARPPRSVTTSLPKSPKRPPRDLGAKVFVVVVLLFLFAPMLVIILFSFHDSTRLSLPFEGFSLRWYQDIWDDELVRRAFERTARAAVLTGLVTGVLAMSASLALVHFRVRVRATVLFLAALPMAFPVLLYSIGLAIVYHEVGIGFSLNATIAGHVIIALPFVFLVIGSALERFRYSLLDAATDLGASKARAFFTITLPLILPAVLGATLLAMALSADEFVVAFFTAGQDKTLPLVMYGRLTSGADPSLNAIATVLMVVTTGLAFVSARRTTKEVA